MHRRLSHAAVIKGPRGLRPTAQVLQPVSALRKHLNRRIAASIFRLSEFNALDPSTLSAETSLKSCVIATEYASSRNWLESDRQHGQRGSRRMSAVGATGTRARAHRPNRHRNWPTYVTVVALHFPLAFRCWHHVHTSVIHPLPSHCCSLLLDSLLLQSLLSTSCPLLYSIPPCISYHFALPIRPTVRPPHQLRSESPSHAQNAPHADLYVPTVAQNTFDEIRLGTTTSDTDSAAWTASPAPSPHQRCLPHLLT